MNNDSLIVQVKPVIKQTTRCSLDLTGEASIDSELKTGELNVEVNVEINYNRWETVSLENTKNHLFPRIWWLPNIFFLRFQEVLELKFLTLDHLNLDKMFVGDDVDAKNRTHEFDIISATELFQVYYVVWLGNSQTDKTASKVNNLVRE